MIILSLKQCNHAILSNGMEFFCFFLFCFFFQVTAQCLLRLQHRLFFLIFFFTFVVVKSRHGRIGRSQWMHAEIHVKATTDGHRSTGHLSSGCYFISWFLIAMIQMCMSVKVLPLKMNGKFIDLWRWDKKIKKKKKKKEKPQSVCFLPGKMVSSAHTGQQQPWCCCCCRPHESFT